MARTDNLKNYLTDVAAAIKDKKGDDTPINASTFDTEIANLPGGGSPTAIDINGQEALFLTGSEKINKGDFIERFAGTAVSSQVSPTSFSTFDYYYSEMYQLDDGNLFMVASNFCRTYSYDFDAMTTNVISETTLFELDFLLDLLAEYEGDGSIFTLYSSLYNIAWSRTNNKQHYVALLSGRFTKTLDGTTANVDRCLMLSYKFIDGTLELEYHTLLDSRLSNSVASSAYCKPIPLSDDMFVCSPSPLYSSTSDGVGGGSNRYRVIVEATENGFVLKTDAKVMSFSARGYIQLPHGLVGCIYGSDASYSNRGNIYFNVYIWDDSQSDIVSTKGTGSVYQSSLSGSVYPYYTPKIYIKGSRIAITQSYQRHSKSSVCVYDITPEGQVITIMKKDLSSSEASIYPLQPYFRDIEPNIIYLFYCSSSSNSNSYYAIQIDEETQTGTVLYKVLNPNFGASFFYSWYGFWDKIYNVGNNFIVYGIGSSTARATRLALVKSFNSVIKATTMDNIGVAMETKQPDEILKVIQAPGK